MDEIIHSNSLHLFRMRMDVEFNEGISIEGRYYLMRSEQGITISGLTDNGVRYGVFAFLRYLQMHKPLNDLNIIGTGMPSDDPASL